MMPVSFRRGRAVVLALLAAKSVLLTSVAVSYAEMPHNRRCDIAQDNPGNLNPAGGNAIMFGLCSGIRIYQLARNQADITLGMRSIVVIRLTDKARFVEPTRTTTMTWTRAGQRAGKLLRRHARRVRALLIKRER